MFDLTQKSSFLNALKWKRDLDNKCTLADGNPVPCMLLANKVRLRDLPKISPFETGHAEQNGLIYPFIVCHDRCKYS